MLVNIFFALVNSAKLIMWERKGSLSFKNNLLTASCQCTLQFCREQRWLGKGRQDFPHSGPTHSPWASKSICSEGYFARLVRNKDLWEPATISGACQSLLTQDRDFYRWHGSEQPPFQLLGPRPELLQWDGFVYLFWKFYLPRILYSAWFFFSNPLLALKCVLWMFYLEPYTFKTLHIV